MKFDISLKKFSDGNYRYVITILDMIEDMMRVMMILNPYLVRI